MTIFVLCICHIELHHYYITNVFIQCSKCNKTQNSTSNFPKIHEILFQCPLACLGFIIPIENFTLIRRRHRNRWRGGELKMLTYTRISWPVNTHCKQKLVTRYVLSSLCCCCFACAPLFKYSVTNKCDLYLNIYTVINENWLWKALHCHHLPLMYANLSNLFNSWSCG